MLRRLRSQLTYANVTSSLALALVLGGGTAYAAATIGTSNLRYHAVTASKLDTNAVTPSKVRNDSLGSDDIRNASLTADDVRNGSLKAEDFGPDQLPKGEKGDPASSVWGAISSSGALAYGKGVSTVTASAGVATVTFAQDVSRCAIVATVGGHAIGDPKQDAAGTVTVRPGATPQAVLFTTRALETGAAEALPFHFAVFC